MKRYFTLVLLTLFVSVSYAMTSTNADNTPVQMTVSKHTTNNNNELERNLEPCIVEVFYDTNNGEIKCELYNIGATDVYVVDIMGNIIDERHIDADFTTHVHLSSACCNGGFYIVVDSEYVYAEGYVHK